ncbi:hypothetical protein RB623_01325 [Mesorhizobium sp. LHD-90]|uniref:hypothetical protein n=1 Tax=Mesorhizobium sp. LHD-90 TaxID=3071414 RepID=UPI0027DEB24D|nr:hypothetical protein [Mesorhizobium sp. LHD-90]MDQ6432691.1 hypothetical protein [Mesorhizobium sp. LHD-90]
MGITREFFETWLQENVGNLPSESEVSLAVLARQFEQDAEAAGYSQEVREAEIGNIEEAIEEALNRANGEEEAQDTASAGDSDATPAMDTLEVDDAKSGP